MRPRRLLTIFTDIFFLWVLLYFGLGGVQQAAWLLAQRSSISPTGLLSWLLLALVVFLLLFRSDGLTDLPLFVAGWALGYWGEWWGTTRGVWTYWNGAQPPAYLPPLWGLGLVTVYRLSTLVQPALPNPLPRWLKVLLAGSFIVLPLAAFVSGWPALAAVDWNGRLDAHFGAGLLVGAGLVLYRFDLRRAFPLYLCGLLLGGLYEYLGTNINEWQYITGEQPPLWIAPLWGLASLAMVNLADILRCAFRIKG